MTDLPQVGQKYQHKKWGEVEVVNLIKRGRGYTVVCMYPSKEYGVTINVESPRLKDFQKATEMTAAEALKALHDGLGV